MGEIVLSEIAKDLIINIINILVLFFIVKLLVYKPVKKFLAERAAKIKEMNDTAKANLEKAETADNEKEKIISEGKKESEKIISEANLKAKENAEKIIDSAKIEAEKIVAKARDEMLSEHRELISSAKDELTEMAIDISSKILKREVNSEDNERIVDDFFAKIGEEK